MKTISRLTPPSQSTDPGLLQYDAMKAVLSAGNIVKAALVATSTFPSSQLSPPIPTSEAPLPNPPRGHQGLLKSPQELLKTPEGPHSSSSTPQGFTSSSPHLSSCDNARHIGPNEPMYQAPVGGGIERYQGTLCSSSDPAPDKTSETR